MIAKLTPASIDDLWSSLPGGRAGVEKALLRYLPTLSQKIDSPFNEAVNYAVFPGGKRFRPLLTLLAAELAGGSFRQVLPAAAAVEFIHTSSLILDDLPAMDRATLRRGRPCLHLRFGEGQALLVAIALLNTAYQLVLDEWSGDRDIAIRAHKELTTCIGVTGMVGGQALDLSFKGPRADESLSEQMETIRNVKTSALFGCALRLGATLCGASYSQVAALSSFADVLGNAYQRMDDLMDIREDLGAMAGPAEVQPVSSIREERFKSNISSLLKEAERMITSEFGSSPRVDLLRKVGTYLAAAGTSHPG